MTKGSKLQGQRGTQQGPVVNQILAQYPLFALLARFPDVEAAGTKAVRKPMKMKAAYLHDRSAVRLLPGVGFGIVHEEFRNEGAFKGHETSPRLLAGSE